MLGEEITGVLSEFLVVFLHAVAYTCHVYPESTFSLVRQYGMATYENNYPGMRIWAENAVKALMQLIYASADKNKPAIISVIVLEDALPIERFGLELRKYIIPEPVSQQALSQSSEIPAADVFEQFRACLTKLYSSVKSGVSAGDRSITLMFEGEPQLNEVPEAWITAESQSPQNRGRIEPIREIDLHNGESVFAMNIFRQRAHNKKP